MMLAVIRPVADALFGYTIFGEFMPLVFITVKIHACSGSVCLH